MRLDGLECLVQRALYLAQCRLHLAQCRFYLLQEIRFDYERGQRGTYWHGAPPAETVWRAARAQPPSAVDGDGEGEGDGAGDGEGGCYGGGEADACGGARDGGEAGCGGGGGGGGSQPPARAMDVLDAIQRATRATASAGLCMSGRWGAQYRQGDLGLSLERAIEAMMRSRPAPFEWSGGGGGGGGGRGSGSSGSASASASTSDAGGSASTSTGGSASSSARSDASGDERLLLLAALLRDDPAANGTRGSLSALLATHLPGRSPEECALRLDVLHCQKAAAAAAQGAVCFCGTERHGDHSRIPFDGSWVQCDGCALWCVTWCST